MVVLWSYFTNRSDLEFPYCDRALEYPRYTHAHRLRIDQTERCFAPISLPFNPFILLFTQEREEELGKEAVPRRSDPSRIVSKRWIEADGYTRVPTEFLYPASRESPCVSSSSRIESSFADRNLSHLSRMIAKSSQPILLLACKTKTRKRVEQTKYLKNILRKLYTL